MPNNHKPTTTTKKHAPAKQSVGAGTKPRYSRHLLLVYAGFVACLLVGGSLWYVGTRQTFLSSLNDSHRAGDEPLTPKQHVVTLKPDNHIPPVQNGLAPVIDTVSTKEPVVFLGIDDGQNKQPFEIMLMEQYHIRASLFLANDFIKNNPSFFKGFTARGSLIENHTVTHQLMSHLSYEQQKQEICDEADLQQKQFGRRPILFRPPGGDFNVDTQRAAAACGMKAVVLWIAKANGGSMQYQIGDKLRPGDIVLMHFRPEFARDLKAFVKAEQAAGLHTELLENWLPN